jgi:hypothetical protein
MPNVTGSVLQRQVTGVNPQQICCNVRGAGATPPLDQPLNVRLGLLWHGADQLQHIGHVTGWTKNGTCMSPLCQALPTVTYLNSRRNEDDAHAKY